MQRWTVMGMAKCKDCLHYEACLTFSKIINAARDVEKGCEHFKDRTDVVEVVRCKDCKHCSIDTKFGSCWCYGYSVNLDHFCSYGERRDNERKAD